MRFMLGIGTRVLHVDITTGTWAKSEPEPDQQPEAPSIYDVSRAETQVRPQWDHEGPVPVARLGFQPNEEDG